VRRLRTRTRDAGARDWGARVAANRLRNSLRCAETGAKVVLMENKKRAARAVTQPLQLRRKHDDTDFAREESTVPLPGEHRPVGDRYNVECERTDTRATIRIAGAGGRPRGRRGVRPPHLRIRRLST